MPFAFIPGDRQIPKPRDPRPAVEVRALPERWDLAIQLPQARRLPRRTARRDASTPTSTKTRACTSTKPRWRCGSKNQGVIGAAAEVDLDDIRNARTQRIAFAIAKTLIEREEFFAALGGAQRPWLFPQLVDITRQWLDQCVTTETGVTKGHLLLTQAGARAAEKVFSSIIRVSREQAAGPDADHPPFRLLRLHRRRALRHAQGRHGPPARQVPPQPRRARRPARKLLGREQSPRPWSTTRASGRT